MHAIKYHHMAHPTKITSDWNHIKYLKPWARINTNIITNLTLFITQQHCQKQHEFNSSFL